MSPEVRRLLDGSSPVVGFNAFTFLEVADAPCILVADALGAGAYALKVWRHLVRFGAEYERELGRGTRFSIEFDGVMIAVVWRVMSSSADDRLVIVVAPLEEQHAAEAALNSFEHHLDRLDRVAKGGHQ